MEAKIITIVGGGSTYTPGVVKAILSKKDTFTSRGCSNYCKRGCKNYLS